MNSPALPSNMNQNILQSKSWTWHIPSGETASELRRISLLPENLVKETPVRAVYHCGDYFLKLERPGGVAGRLRSMIFPKARAEYRIGKALEAERIPAVECVGWGQCGSQNLLITRALPCSESVDEFFYRQMICGGEDPAEFLALLLAFLRRFFDAGFLHTDLHFGNLLYLKQEKRLALVDLIAIRPKCRLSDADRRRMSRVVVTLRAGLTSEQMLNAIREIGAAGTNAEAESFYLETIAMTSSHLLENWSKRRSQVLSGYRKFTTALPCPADPAAPDVLLCRDGISREIITPDDWQAKRLPPGSEQVVCSSPAEAENLFLRSFFLRHMRIRHRRVLAFVRPDILLYESIPSDLRPAPPCPDLELDFFRKTLNAMKIQVPEDGISSIAPGKFYLTDLDRIRAGFEA